MPLARVWIRDDPLSKQMLLNGLVVRSIHGIRTVRPRIREIELLLKAPPDAIRTGANDLVHAAQGHLLPLGGTRWR